MTLFGLSVSTAMAAAPVNDNFVNASVINLNALPFGGTVDITLATTESGEGFSCSYSYQTIWYKFAPAADTWLSANASGGTQSGGVTVYRDTGSGLYGLVSMGCSSYGGSAIFLARAGTTCYLQGLAPCCGVSGTLRVNLARVPAPVPTASFNSYPSDPSTFETVQFYDNSSDPGQVGIWSRAWDFGDGATDTTYGPVHRYAADGSYTVQLTITTYDGRTASTSQTVVVKTHDVAITRFKTPTSAAAGQTRQISVGLVNARYPETVRVELFRSSVGGYSGFESIGTEMQSVPVRASNRTTDFDFNYTFTGDDASTGKLTFKAVATVLTGRDALSADNEAISSPTKVSRSGARGVADIITPTGRSVTSRTEEPGNETAAPMREVQLALLRVAPNPATAGVDLLVRLSLPTDGGATLQVLDVAGRVMAERDLGPLGRGIHQERVSWERRPAAGIYWVRLTQGGKSVSAKVGILR
jgi:PKD repeat protein